jgi:hypothetical protein
VPGFQMLRVDPGSRSPGLVKPYLRGFFGIKHALRSRLFNCNALLKVLKA